MPCRTFDSARPSTSSTISDWPRRSMKPGATTAPRASIRRRAGAPSSRPIAAIRSPRIPTSARNQGAPLPSTTRPFAMTRSYSALAAFFSRTPSHAASAIATRIPQASLRIAAACHVAAAAATPSGGEEALVQVGPAVLDEVGAAAIEAGDVDLVERAGGLLPERGLALEERAVEAIDHRAGRRAGEHPIDARAVGVAHQRDERRGRAPSVVVGELDQEVDVFRIAPVCHQLGRGGGRLLAVEA